MKPPLIFPCCKTELPEALGGVEEVICSCGQVYNSPQIIIEYNEMREIITDWRDVLNGKALVKAEPGQEHFIADLMRRGLKYT
jgi:hypothetical protein